MIFVPTGRGPGWILQGTQGQDLTDCPERSTDAHAEGPML